MSATTTLDQERLDALTGSVSGRVLLAGDDGCEEARRVHNGLVDRRPALIVRCRGAGTSCIRSRRSPAG
jgi:hypothetical protein